MENIFQEYNDPFYKETIINIKECDISFLQLDNIYFIESQLNNEKKDSIFNRRMRVCGNVGCGNCGYGLLVRSI